MRNWHPMQSRRAGLCGLVLAAVVLVAGSAAAGGSTPGRRAAPAPTSLLAVTTGAVQKVMSQPRYAHSRWGLLTQDLRSGAYANRMNDQQLFIPGSSAKLFANSAAWQVLGPEHRFVTPIYRQGTVTGGRLIGNLVLVASGDLTLGGRTKPDGTVDFTNNDHNDANALPGLATLTPEDPLAGLDQLARQVRDSGITAVSGNVAVDDRLFGLDRAQNPQTPTTPIIVNDNLIDTVSTPTTVGAPAQFSYRPHTSAYQLSSTVTTVAAGLPIQLHTTQVAPGHVLLSGQVPAGAANPVVWTYQVDDPAAFARSALIDALARAGVHVTAPATGTNPTSILPAPGSYAPTDRVAAYTSPPLSEYVKLILKVSLNLGANLEVCLLAVHAGSTNCLDGLPVIHHFLADQANVPVDQLVLNDGQGGSPNDQVTPQAVTDLLRYLASRPDFTRFRASLPILGRDGSLADVATTSPAAGHVFAKTGTLAAGDLLNNRLLLSTKALAGYIDTRDGRHLAFALYVNNVPAPGGLPDLLQVNQDLGTIAALLWRRPS